MYLTFFVKYKDIYRRFDEHHREKAYRCNTIEKFLKNCKLSVLGKLDNYQTDSITDISERIVYVVKKYK
jgi:hypothetical protein